MSYMKNLLWDMWERNGGMCHDCGLERAIDGHIVCATCDEAAFQQDEEEE